MSVMQVDTSSEPVVLFIVLFESTLRLSSVYNLTAQTLKSHSFITAIRTIALAYASILAIVTFSYPPFLVFSLIACMAFWIRSSIDPIYCRIRF